MRYIVAMRVERELMRGSGPLAVMQLLSRRAMYGYELVEALDRESEGVLAMGQSTLYPLLYNLESKGLISGRTEDAEGGRVRRYYSLTPAGRKELTRQRQSWRSLAQAMQALGILGAAGAK
jgi:PadR family transcriptional regulator, regulatory protein PadR